MGTSVGSAQDEVGMAQWDVLITGATRCPMIYGLALPASESWGWIPAARTAQSPRAPGSASQGSPRGCGWHGDSFGTAAPAQAPPSWDWLCAQLSHLCVCPGLHLLTSNTSKNIPVAGICPA